MESKGALAATAERESKRAQEMEQRLADLKRSQQENIKLQSTCGTTTFIFLLSIQSFTNIFDAHVADLKREREQLTQEIERLRAQLESAERTSGSALEERFEAQMRSLRTDNQTLQQTIEYFLSVQFLCARIKL